jgi:hypothetical protein
MVSWPVGAIDDRSGDFDGDQAVFRELSDGEGDGGLKIGKAWVGKGNDPCRVGDKKAVAGRGAGVFAAAEVGVEAVFVADGRD